MPEQVEQSTIYQTGKTLLRDLVQAKLPQDETAELLREIAVVVGTPAEAETIHGLGKAIGLRLRTLALSADVESLEEGLRITRNLASISEKLALRRNTVYQSAKLLLDDLEQADLPCAEKSVWLLRAAEAAGVEAGSSGRAPQIDSLRESIDGRLRSLALSATLDSFADARRVAEELSAVREELRLRLEPASDPAPAGTVYQAAKDVFTSLADARLPARRELTFRGRIEELTGIKALGTLEEFGRDVGAKLRRLTLSATPQTLREAVRIARGLAALEKELPAVRGK